MSSINWPAIGVINFLMVFICMLMLGGIFLVLRDMMERLDRNLHISNQSNANAGLAARAISSSLKNPPEN